ncbi:MAG TPA: Ku protein [Steroidobacteraceae bacterium]|nr:Ku protein [Steroidobacteraceae bacterium]
MARAIWKGAISFSLINIPVSLHAARRPAALDLDLLDKRDFSPVGYQRINKKTGRKVERDDIVKGYQYRKGEYVVLSDEDFRQANVAATQTIDIHAFVDPRSIAPPYFDTPYYLAPEKHGAKSYALLHDALARSERLAVASFVMHVRQHLVALLPFEGLIVLDTLRYPDEILPAANLSKSIRSAGRASATPRELQLALRLLEEMSGEWRPQQYRDTYRDDLLKRIEEKVKAGKTRTLTEPVKTPSAPSGEVIDLMALLRESLDEKRRGGRAIAARHQRLRASRTRGRRVARRA